MDAPSFTDITEWDKKPYSSTGGTRAKKIYVNQDLDREFFFKGSKKLSDGGIRYPSEFWSEIISSKIGMWLGFDILDYNIGYDKNANQKVGCLSESMIKYSESELTEGQNYLIGKDNSYNPKEDEDRYTLSFIKETLEEFDLGFYNNVLEMLIFDIVIGNSDRHQENWGIITDFGEVIRDAEYMLSRNRNWMNQFIQNIRRTASRALSERTKDFKNRNKPISKGQLQSHGAFYPNRFSPIYDSGCCLGRELLDDKIEKMLRDEQMIKSYVMKGRSEIRFKDGKKPKHFDVLNFIIENNKSVFYQVRDRVKKSYNNEKLRGILFNIDKNLPDNLDEYKLTENRKELMYKILTLRIDKVLNP